MIPLSIPDLSGNELDYLRQCIESGWVSSAGPFVDLFEKNVAEQVGVRYAVATVNGTAALHIALLTSGLKPDEEVIAPTLTFIAPINAIRYCGAHPLFMDCDRFLNIDLEKIDDFLKKRSVVRGGQVYNKTTGRRIHGILPVHIFGFPVDMDLLLQICKNSPLKIIEDSTEALGSRYKGRGVASFGTSGCLSFNGNKIITTGGGGMLVTNDEVIARKARYLTTQAKDDAVNYLHHEVGYNYRLSNLQAAVGVAQLERLESFIEAKKQNFHTLAELIRPLEGLSLIPPPPETNPNYWYTALCIEKPYRRSRDELFQILREKGVETRPLWTLNHEQKPYLKSETYRIEQASRLREKILNLPCSPTLTRRELDEIVGLLREAA